MFRVVNIGSTAVGNWSTSSQSPVPRSRGERYGLPNAVNRRCANRRCAGNRTGLSGRQGVKRQIGARELIRAAEAGSTCARLRLRVMPGAGGDQQQPELAGQTVAGIRRGKAQKRE